MTVQNSIQEVKSSLAKLLATENLSVQYAHVETASFDTKNRVLVLPLFKDLNEQCLDLFVGHEVAHALWTPAEGLQNLPIKDKNFHSFVNVTEDARIERLIQNKYPGLKKVFYNAYGELSEKDFFGLSQIDDINEMLFIDRLNLKAKLGSQIDLEFKNDIEETFYNRSMLTKTFDEVVELAEDIYEYCKQELEEKQTEQPDDERQVEPQSSDDTQEDGDDNEQDTTTSKQMRDVDWSEGGEDEAAQKDEEQSASSDEVEDATEDAEADQQSEETEEDEVDDGENQQGPTSANPGLEAKTDLASQNATKQMVDLDLSNSIAYLDLPQKIDVSKVIVPFKTVHEEILSYWSSSNRDQRLAENATAFKKKNQKVINYLHKEFEMKKAAEVYSKSFESKTGVINTQRLYSYKYTEDIFKKATTAPNGKSHGIVFFLDWSGSMAENLKGTVEQLINLALFCRKSNIPFDAYAFSSEYGKFDGRPTEYQSTNLYEVALGNCNLIELFNHKMNTRQFNRSIEIWLAVSCMFDRRGRGDFGYWGLPRKYYLSGTPLDEAIVLATKLVPEFQKKANVQIVNTVFLTDGASHRLQGQFVPGETIDGSPRTSEEFVIANTLYIRDKKTSKSVKITSQRFNRDSGRITKALYMMLKGVTGCNLVGFFIADNRDIGYAFDHFYKDPEFELTGMTQMRYNEMKSDFKKLMTKEKAVVAMHSGMDELYIIKGGKALEISDEGLQVADTASKAQITTAFKKMTKGKLQNRVILQKFIEKIAA